ncbi:oligoendopeptidase F [Aerococcus urinaeequi]|uniref:oligoendopeptidase F n=1 Tax=Aerococcus urinaeequi TaxID=51665 RepID=UPI003D6C11A9
MTTENTFPTRDQVDVATTWDLSQIFEDEATFEAKLAEFKDLGQAFKENYEGKLSDASEIANAVLAASDVQVLGSQLMHYTFLAVEADRTNSQAALKLHKVSAASKNVQEAMLFFQNALLEKSATELQKVKAIAPETADYIAEVERQQAIYLGAKVEDVLFQFEQAHDQNYEVYNNAKLADLTFPDFEVDGTTYPLSFVLYEDKYMFEEDTAVRRAAFDAFSKELAKYQNTFATTYYGHVLQEKAQANIRGYESVIDYLLFSQDVNRDLYDRQIDVIMEKLAPVMRKYINHVKEVRGLDKMTYADLKIGLDPTFSKSVSFEESEAYVKEATAIMGEDYFKEIAPAFTDRWVDYAQNVGKSTGGFATIAAGVHPYILMSWTEQLSDVYTLIHELGHAGQMSRAEANNLFISSEPSLYVIEAPSTFNELLLTGYLQANGEDDRTQRFALANMLTNTYFHNFITHLLEAAYQREVYRLIDKGEAFTAETLSDLKKGVLEAFWGDAVEINPGAELTWMRQPHYYMGLYSYTYSAGLTIATQAYLNIRSGEDDQAIEKWINFLKLGRINPVEAAKVAGVDITSGEPLENTIAFLNDTVDAIIDYSAKLA